MLAPLKYITLKRLAKMASKYNTVIFQQQLTDLACPYTLRIGLKRYPVPLTIDEFRDSICWGQRLMMATEHQNDFESILFFVANYYQPIITKKPFDEKLVMKVYRKLAYCNVQELYPVLMRLVKLFTEVVEIEAQKLDSKPSKDMLAAEINRLQPFSDMNILELVSNRCRVPLSEAHLIEYNIVFALLWAEKETADFNKRFSEIQIAKQK